MALIITDKEMMAFDKQAQQQLINELYQYCKSSFPHWVEKMGDDNVITAINWLIKTAKQIGLERRSSLFFYLNTSLLLGSLFYQDEQYKKLWLDFEREIYLPEKERINLLYQQMSPYLQHVNGEKNTFISKALEYLGEVDILNLNNKGDVVITLLVTLRYFYPEKVNFLGQDAYLEFIHYGIEKAKNSYALLELDQQATFILLMFFLGQHFDQDPFLAWFNWFEQLEKIRNNQFSFNQLANQLLIIRT